jgi:hypothetical protein
MAMPVPLLQVEYNNPEEESDRILVNILIPCIDWIIVETICYRKNAQGLADELTINLFYSSVSYFHGLNMSI